MSSSFQCSWTMSAHAIISRIKICRDILEVSACLRFGAFHMCADFSRRLFCSNTNFGRILMEWATANTIRCAKSIHRWSTQNVFTFFRTCTFCHHIQRKLSPDIFYGNWISILPCVELWIRLKASSREHGRVDGNSIRLPLVYTAQMRWAMRDRQCSLVCICLLFRIFLAQSTRPTLIRMCTHLPLEFHSFAIDIC